jgi:hypothetical protein
VPKSHPPKHPEPRRHGKPRRKRSRWLIIVAAVVAILYGTKWVVKDWSEIWRETHHFIRAPY